MKITKKIYIIINFILLYAVIKIKKIIRYIEKQKSKPN